MKLFKTFNHPQKGKCKVREDMLAIFWKDSIPENECAETLSKLKLETVSIKGTDKAGISMKLMVNNTARLNFISSKGRSKEIDEKTLAALENSDIVEWVSFVLEAPAIESPDKPPVITGYETLFTIHPANILVQGELALADIILENKNIPLEINRKKSSIFPNLTVFKVDTPSLVMDRTVFNIVNDKLMPPGITYYLENIPFLSPLTCGCNQSGQPGQLTRVTPNDPKFAIQWALQQINAPYGWSVTEGDPSVVVAVIDEGVELNHPDLSLHPDSWNCSTDMPNGGPTGNHGTACAGIIAAKADNGVGVAGVAGKCRIMAIATGTWSDVDIAEGLYFAADHGARVVSMSFGVYPWWNFWVFQLVQDALQYAYDKGLVLVAASGNENMSTSRFPGSDARTICVGGTNRADLRKAVNDTSAESWWGACYGNSLDVCAPCLEIATTDRLGNQGYSSGDYHDFFNGTSSATPLVAGLAALLFSANPQLDNETVREIIESTCEKVRTDVYTYTNVGFKINGTWNFELGYGRINVERALSRVCGHSKHKGECCSCTESYLSLPETDKACVSVKPSKWVDCGNCMKWYIPVLTTREDRLTDQRFLRIEVEVTKELSLCLKGRNPGKLLYTTSLLPGEEVKLYHYERYRRVTNQSERMSVHTSFRQSVAALWQSRVTSDMSTYFKNINNVRAEYDSSGSLIGILAGSVGGSAETTIDTGFSLRTTADIFSQVATSASAMVEAERSIVISNYEERETADITSRTFKNHNDCKAVTFYIRRINEVYDLTTRIVSIRWRIVDMKSNVLYGWRDAGQVNTLPPELRIKVTEILKGLPKVGDVERTDSCINLPTDGTFIESELAYCSSCDPLRAADLEISLETKKAQARKLCLEAELLSIEVERRKKELAQGSNVTG